MEGKYNHHASSQNSDKNQQFPLALTISEYAEIAQRLEESHKKLGLVGDALSTPENLKNMRSAIEDECDRMTMRLKILKLQGT